MLSRIGFKYALQGLKTVWKEQFNFKIHLMVSGAVIAAGWFFRITVTEWLIVLVLIGLVLAMELMNSAVEYLTDLVSPQIHPLAGKAKDAGAAAVLLAATLSVVCGVIIFLPYLFKWLQSLPIW